MYLAYKFILVCLLHLSPILYGASCVNKTCESYVHLAPTPDPLVEVKALNVAILTAGGVRSFAFNERSWRRYLIDPWKSSNIHVFAHLTAPKKNCPLYEKGIEAMKNLATEFEVSYALTPLLSHSEVRSRFGKVKSCLIKMNTDNLFAGNIIDMHARRHRAYEMAMHYSKVGKFEWHIMMFVRPDTAFYSPKIEFYKIFKGIKNHTEVTGRKAMIIPPGCSFGHICDRAAIGLASDMATYFNLSMLSEVAAWSNNIGPDDPPAIVSEKKWFRDIYICSGEQLIKIWLDYIHGYELTDTLPAAQSFITQRSLSANDYCIMPRQEFKQKRSGRWGDKTTIRWTPTSGFDYSDNAEERCGPIYTMNATQVCLTPECDCGKKN